MARDVAGGRGMGNEDRRAIGIEHKLTTEGENPLPHNRQREKRHVL